MLDGWSLRLLEGFIDMERYVGGLIVLVDLAFFFFFLLGSICTGGNSLGLWLNKAGADMLTVAARNFDGYFVSHREKCWVRKMGGYKGCWIFQVSNVSPATNTLSWSLNTLIVFFFIAILFAYF